MTFIKLLSWGFLRQFSVYNLTLTTGYFQFIFISYITYPFSRQTIQMKTESPLFIK